MLNHRPNKKYLPTPSCFVLQRSKKTWKINRLWNSQREKKQLTTIHFTLSKFNCNKTPNCWMAGPRSVGLIAKSDFGNMNIILLKTEHQFVEPLEQQPDAGLCLVCGPHNAHWILDERVNIYVSSTKHRAKRQRAVEMLLRWVTRPLRP